MPETYYFTVKCFVCGIAGPENTMDFQMDKWPDYDGAYGSYYQCRGEYLARAITTMRSWASAAMRTP